MRVGSAWADSCVLNISSRGLRLSCASPPPRGAYLEVRRGYHVIVGRVMWSDRHCCGIKTQDLIPIDDFISAERPETRSGPRPADPPPVADRPRRNYALRHERSRQRSRVMQYASFAMLGAAAALVARGMIVEVFSNPLETVQAALAQQ